MAVRSGVGMIRAGDGGERPLVLRGLVTAVFSLRWFTKQ